CAEAIPRRSPQRAGDARCDRAAQRCRTRGLGALVQRAVAAASMSFTYTIWFAIFGLLIGHAPGAVVGAVTGFIFDNLHHSQRKQAVVSFNVGKQPEFDVTRTIAEMRNWGGMRRDHALPVLDVVIERVLAEGNPGPEKMSILRQLAFALRISDMELMALMAMKGYAW